MIVAMLACTRIGAIHSVIFAGFSPESVHERLLDSESRVLITVNGTKRGAKLIDLKSACDQACDLVRQDVGSSAYRGVEHMIVCQRMDPKNLKCKWVEGRDKWWHEIMQNASSADQKVEWMDAEDPLFMLYTSGSTGRPKGVIHTTGG